MNFVTEFCVRFAPHAAPQNLIKSKAQTSQFVVCLAPILVWESFAGSSGQFVVHPSIRGGVLYHDIVPGLPGQFIVHAPQKKLHRNPWHPYEKQGLKTANLLSVQTSFFHHTTRD